MFMLMLLMDLINKRIVFSICFISLFVIINGSNKFSSREVNSAYVADVTCSREFRKQSNLLHRSSLCRSPRKMLVPIVMPSNLYIPGMIHRPQSYEVERCDGVCSQANHKCLPIAKEMIDIPVTMDSIFKRLVSITGLIGGKGHRPQEKCMKIQIEKHVRCGCQCGMTADNCSEKQRFDEERCSCSCIDNSKAASCAASNKMWSQSTCDCECPSDVSQDCSTGAVFDKETCRCQEVFEMFGKN